MVSALDRKLGRDLWRIKGQAAAIGLVVAVGVLMQVMQDGLINSLSETKQAYYDRYRLADVFAPLKRAPRRVLDDLAGLPGVAAAEGRVRGSALIDLPALAVPVFAQAVSLPDYAAARLNEIHLAAGRRPDPTRSAEILLLEGFAQAHGLAPGDRLAATMNGLRRDFQIVGLAQSPEFLYSVPPGEIVPDDERFAVIWLSQSAMAAIYDLDGAFNEALLALARGAGGPAAIVAADRVLGPYGGRGAYAAADSISDKFITQEIKGLTASSQVVPPIFLAIAAFLLYIVTARIVQAERAQIGLLKAFGYRAGEVAAHYLKLVVLIAAAGAAAGCVLGVLAGRALVGLYLLFFKFPFLLFEVDPRTLATGLAVSVAAAAAGGLIALGAVFALTPAVAMRPPAPADYSRFRQFGRLLKALLDQPSRMVLRRIIRQPGRFALSALSIAAGMGIAVATLGVHSGFRHVADINFNHIDRSDALVSFVEPLGAKALFELSAIDGVISAEPVRYVPAQLRHGLFTHSGGITGLPAEPALNRAVDAQLQPIFVRGDGIILAKPLAEILRIQTGQILSVAVRTGSRPVLELPVVGIAETLLGTPAYMQIEALNRALGEPGRISGAHLRIDAARADAAYRALKQMPAIAGVSLKEQARASFQEVMDTGAGAMRYIMILIAGIISFGIIYNSARVAFAERERDLASLRVLGFTRGEAAFVLLGELALIALASLPLGALAGAGLAQAIAAGFSTDLYRIPAAVTPANYGIATLAVLGAALISGCLVKRDLDRVNLLAALKTPV